MYIMIRTLGKESVQAGEPVVIRYDTPFGRVGAFDVGGRLLGYVDEGAPEGCLDAWRIYARIGNRRVIANTAVVFDGAILLFTDSAVFGEEKTFVRVEKEGYGILVG